MIRMTRIAILSATISAGSLIVPANAVPVSPARAMHNSNSRQQQPELLESDVSVGLLDQKSERLNSQSLAFANVSNPIATQSEIESTSLNLPNDPMSVTRGVADRQFLGASATIPSPLGDGAPTAHVVPLPTAAWTGLSMLALLGVIKFCRNYRRILT